MVGQSTLPREETNDFLDRPTYAAGYFSAEECSCIIGLSTALSKMEGGITDKGTLASSVRSSTVRWMTLSEKTGWIYEKLWAAVEEVNQRYRFEILGIREMQIARYRQGDFYDWHLDIGKTDTSSRKLSLSVQLSAPDDYAGGELVVAGYENEKPVKEIGSVIVFPSYLSHRVNEVTAKERWSLVAWVHGPPFR